MEKTKGQLFKEKTGFSKTRKRLMEKHGVPTVAEYRLIVKNRKKKEKKLQKDKHLAAKLGRKPKKAKQGKGGKPIKVAEKK